MAAWYYAKDGEQVGPFESAELRNLATAGQLLPTDLLWREGLSQWVAASTVKGLFPATTASPAATAPAVARTAASPTRPAPAQSSNAAVARQPVAALSPAARIDRTVATMGALRLNNPTAYAGPTDIIPQNFDNGVSMLIVILALTVFLGPCLIIIPLGLVHVLWGSRGHSSVAAATHGYSTTLLTGVDPKSQGRSGKWSAEGGIVRSSGKGFEMLAIPHQVRDECDIALEFIRRSGDEDIGLEIHRGESTFMVLIGANHNSLMGVDMPNNKRIGFAPDTFHHKNLVPAGPAHHRAVIRVRNQSFDVILDDKYTFHTKADYANWRLDPPWQAAAADPLALATLNSSVEFLSLRVDPPKAN